MIGRGTVSNDLKLLRIKSQRKDVVQLLLPKGGTGSHGLLR